MTAAFVQGIVLPSSVLQTHWFAVLATFVAVNTLIYVVMAVLKIFPRVYPSTWFRRGRQQRSETRHIDPDQPI